MARNEEEILVRIINKVEGADELVKEENLVRSIQKSNGDLTQTYEKQTATQRQRVTVNKSANAAGKEQVSVNKETLAQGPQFQAHYLGLMFGGMALNRAMGNLTATSKEWVGIGEIMSTTMGVVMLPATMELLDTAILPLSNALLSLPEEIQMTIGVTSLGLEGLGKLLEVAGQIALFKIAFPAAFASMTTALGSFASASGLAAAGVSALGVALPIVAAYLFIDALDDAIDRLQRVEELAREGEMALGQYAQATEMSIAPTTGQKVDLSQYADLSGKRVDISSSLPTFSEMGLPDPSSIFGSFAVGGNISNTGLHYLHEGETVLRKDQANNQNGAISITNNINVSDRREMEQMIQKNNTELVREIRRGANR